MIRRTLLLAGLIATACSAQTGGQANGQSARTKNSLPRNSPLEPDIKNVPATTGRANMTACQAGRCR